MHPGNQITVRGTPELARAAEVSLDRRIEHGAGKGGWPCAWYINQWARLDEAEKAYTRLQSMLRNLTTPNLFSGSEIFQIDGNFGGTSGIVGMLLQSHDGAIHSLPALPGAWANGAFTGLRARGAVEVDLSWKGGKAVSGELRPDTDGVRRLRPPLGQQITSVHRGGQSVELDHSSDDTIDVDFHGGRRSALTFS